MTKMGWSSGAISVVAVAVVLAPACGGSVPSMSGTRESGQSGLMDDTVAGKNRCNPDDHSRPFIIEWDATDMARFEQFAASDVVVVKYEGCDLQVLDRCRNDSVPGSLGAYKPIEWTSGSLEKINISTSGELAAELPLGVVTLGGRVSAGEKFAMEYFVAGTRSATRSDVFAKDLQKLPGCEGATHFVYNYNLGAFALGSVQDFNASANMSLYGFGADGSTSRSRQADKQGGDLGKCKSDSLSEIQGCKAPIRLTLRSVKGGGDPDATIPDSDESLNAASKVSARVDAGEGAEAHLQSAEVKLNAGDGAGCLAELDAHDKLNPKGKSTDPKSGKIGDWRGQCLMLTGKCELGKSVSAKAIAAVKGDTIGVDRIQVIVEQYAAMKCRGGDTSLKTKVLGALTTLTEGGHVSAKKPEQCMEAYQTVRRDGPKVKSEDSEDSRLQEPTRHLGFNAALCLAKAGDCERAWKVFSESRDENMPKDDAKLRTLFESMVKQCKK